MRHLPALVVALAACHPSPAAPTTTHYELHELALPGATADGVMMDYLAYDPRTHAVWVPAGNTAGVDVIDTATRAIKRVDGFATREVERNGAKRVIGPSAATLGPAGVVFVGNRGDQTICAIDERTLVRGTCSAPLDAMPDGIAYVDATHEVWVTTPRDKSIRILDAVTLAPKARLELAGEPEGFAVDLAHHRFFTNLEDADHTLAIDLASHAIVATWEPRCGEDGPKGLRYDADDDLLLVACSDKVEVLDSGHGGAIVGTLATGAGVDDFDLAPATRTVYVGAARAGTLTIAALAKTGTLATIASVPTVEGARNGVVDERGAVYLAAGRRGAIVVVAPTR